MNNKTRLGLSGSVLVDDSKELAFSAQVSTTKKKSLLTYMPSLEIRQPDKEDIVFTGLVVVNGRKTGDLDLSLAGISKDTITLKTTLTNTKTEKSFKGVFGLCPKRRYSADIGLILQDNSNKRTMLKIIPTLVIRDPTKNLISLTGSADFKQDKSLRSSLSLSVAKYMNKPTTIKCNWRKMSGKRLRHNAVLIFTSKYASVKMTGLLDKKGKGSASRLTIDYSLPLLKRDNKNRIAFGTKFTERSTKTLFKQKYNVNLDVKRNPELNFDTSVDLAHNSRVTDVSFKMQYGKNYKDISKKITALAVIRHKLIKSSATISYLLKTQWPAQNLNTQVKGNHKHDRKYLKSSVTAKCGKGKTFDATFDLKDLSRKLVKKTVAFTCRYPGNDINFQSSLTQMNPKHYQHSANLKVGKSKSSIMTVLRHQTPTEYELSSDITVHNTKPVHLSGMVNLSRDDFKASGQVATRGKIYSFKSLHKYSKGSAAKCMLDVAYPDRHIIVGFEGKKDGNHLYKTKLDAKWDADNNPMQNLQFTSKMNLTSLYDMDTALTLKYPEQTLMLNFKTGGYSDYITHLDCSWHPDKMVSVDTTWKYKKTYPDLLLGTSLKLKTPFTVINDLDMNVDIINNKQKLTSSVESTMNNQSHHFSMDLTVQKPVSLKKAAVIINTVSSVKGIRNAALSIAYDLSDTLNCNIQGSLEKTETELSIVGKANCNKAARDIEGIIIFNSNIPFYEKCKFTLKHNDDSNMFTTNVALQINTEQWTSDLNVNHSLEDWNMRNSGNLLMSSPHGRVVSNWNHANTHKNVQTKITSDWGNNKRFYLELTGDHSSDTRIKTIGRLQVQTPWTKMNHLEVDVHNEFGAGFYHAISHVKKEGENKLVTDVYYFRSDGNVDFNIDMKTPFYDNIALKLNTMYNVYPVTGHMELEWSSKKHVTADGSLVTRSLSDFAANVRVTTPLRGYKTIIIKATNRKEGKEWISTSSIEYGIRKTLKMEARMQFEKRKKFWVKVETPFKNYKKMHTGIQFELNPHQFTGKAELVGNPVIGKYGGVLFWDTEKDFSCKCRLDTGLKVFPYLEIVAKSTKGRKGQNSRIQIEYSRKKSFIFTSTYQFTGPLLLDITVNTPYQKYKRMTLYFKHSLGRQRFTTHVAASRSTDKLSGNIKFRWNKDIDGTILIKTPFEGYKSSKMSMRHSGKRLNFKNQCNLEIHGEKLIQTAIEFVHNKKTLGSISLKSSRFDDVKLSLDHQGGLANCIGSVSFLQGGVPVLDITLQNQYKTNTLDTELNVRSSHFEDVKLTLDHLGNLKRFSTKITGSMGNKNNFLLDTKFHHTKPVTDFNTLFTYTVGGQINNAGAHLYKDGTLSNLMTKLSGNINKHFVNVKTALMTEGSVDASVTIQTSFEDFQNLGMSLQHSGQVDNFVVENSIQYMDGKYIQSKISFKTTGPKELDVKVEIETPFEAYRHVVVNHNHLIKKQTFTSESGFNDKQIKTKASIKHTSLKHTHVEVKIETPFKGYTKTVLKHYHILTAESFTSSCGYNQHIIGTKVKFPQFELKNVDVTIELTTPFTGYEYSVVEHKHQLQDTLFTSNTQYNDQSLSCVISCEHYSAKYMETKIEIHAPIAGYKNIMFLHKHQLLGKSLVINTEVNYGDSQRGVVDVSVYLEPNVKINAAIQTPFTYLQNANLLVEQKDDRISCTGSVQYGGDKSIDGAATFFRSESNMIEGHVTLHTPFTGYEESKATCTYHLTRNALSMKGKVIYGNGRTILAELNALNVEAMKLNIIIKTPFVGFENSKFVFSHEGALNDFKCHHEAELAGKEIHADFSLLHGVSTIVSFNMTTNNPTLKQAKLSIVKLGGYRNMEFNADATLNDASMKGHLSTRVEKEVCSTSMSFSSPFTENIVASVEHNWRPTGFTTKLSSGLGHDKHVTTFVNFINHGTMVDLNSEVTYVWLRLANHASIGFHKEGQLNNIVVNMNGKYDSKVVEMSAELKTISGVHGKLYLKTPFEKYHSIGMSVDHSGNVNNFASEGRIKYMDEKEIFVKINHYRNAWKRIESTAEVHMPIPKFKYTKIAYRHSSTDNTVSCNTELSYGLGQRLSTDFQLSWSPKFDMSFIVESTIHEYELMEFLTSYEKTWKRYMLDTSLNAGKGRKYAMISILDYTEAPISTSFRISTPITGFETVEFTATHMGELANFRSTAAFQSPYTDSIVCEAMLKYQSILKFDYMMALTSNIKNMKNLRFVARHMNDSGQQQSHIEITWDPTKSIIFDEVFKRENTWDGEHLITDVSITTPFKTMQQSALKIEHVRSTDKYSDKFEAKYNDRPAFDMEVEYSTGPRHDASVSTKHPRPMSLTVLGYRTDSNIDSEVILNWDKTNSNSNLHAQVMYMWGKNKDIKFKLIRPSRTIGFTGSLKHQEKQTECQGEIIWNEDKGQKLTYGFNLNDHSRRHNTMYDGSLEVGLPIRTVKVTGAYSDNRQIQTVDGSLYWDVDDPSKEVSIRTVLYLREATKRADVTFHLPSIEKDIRIGTEMTLNEGRTIFMGKTEISYSEDIRKLLTVMTSLEDMSDSQPSRNYSFVFGITHPFTDVDATFKSQAGFSASMCSSSLDLNYLTAKKEIQNFALMMEINKLRNQMDLQLVTPIKKINITAEVDTTNPYHLRIMNRYDDTKAVTTNVMLDTARRMVDLKISYDLENPSKLVQLTAKYVNSSAIQVGLYHKDGPASVLDSVLALRLNTSQLLHARLHWRPSLVSEIKTLLATKSLMYGERMSMSQAEMSDSVGAELSSKYRRITMSISEEAKPFIALLESELISVDRALDDLRQDLGAMYQTNEFFIQDVGQAYKTFIKYYTRMVGYYRENYGLITHSMSKFLNGMATFPMNDEYEMFVNNLMTNSQTSLDELLAILADAVKSIDVAMKDLQTKATDKYTAVQNRVSKLIDQAKSHPKIKEFHAMFDTTSYRTFLMSVARRTADGIRSSGVADKYASAATRIQDIVSTGLNMALEHEDLKQLNVYRNNVYQEMLWAYRYWDVETNMAKHLTSILDTLEKVLQKEMEEYTTHVYWLQKSNITVYDPKHGEIQAEVYLPFPVNSLDTLPGFQAYFRSIRSYADYYADKINILQKLYLSYFWGSRNKTTEPTADFNEELKTYLNAPQIRRKLKKYKARRM
ncbi:uncharacterized protein LOC121374806 [Gigantopelta aegis]|uniref:uncharacterized protein LOC121374806 n=1 Tax=Gigantopelta aegis TaxID=1735272 RepID=UPI001B88A7F0|nr:uncharacterized protein LOC121374806 [Gigantopelta aegis]